MINSQGTPAIMFDIDGTLAKMHNRGPFMWDKVGQDLPNEHVITFAQNVPVIFPGHKVIVASGRDSVCREQTIEWLQRHKVPFEHLFMRPAKDNRADWIIKMELYKDWIMSKYRVDLVVDDRDQVVRMWRGIGLQCWQVAPGNF